MYIYEKAFDQLSADTLYQLIRLRLDVFVVEQNCPYQDLDNKDTLASTRHLYIREDDRVIAYTRCLAPDVRFNRHSAIGRVVVAAKYRRRGYARIIMHQAIATCRRQWPDAPVMLSAQVYAMELYRGLGFQVTGEPYDEDNIPHQDMVLV